MTEKFENTFEYKVIYIFTLSYESHKNLIKVGDTTLKTNSQPDKLPPNCQELMDAARKRIKEESNTIGIVPEIKHAELAIKTRKLDDGSLATVAFRDYDVHRVLINSNIQRVYINCSTGREWFDTDYLMGIKAIEAVKNNLENLSNSKSKNHIPLIFRPEQEEAIKSTIKHYKTSNRMLWNAKMRFGKTVSALEVVKRMGFSKTIIMTHRPVVDKGWYEDFNKVFWDKEEYIYGSKNANKLDFLLKSGKKFVYFASLQDLRGSIHVGGKYDKNDAVFDTIWDCVIVDEAHEGTTTETGEDTIKSVIKDGNNTKVLELSGTPFKIIDKYDEDSIYTWDYIQEQEAKNTWDELHFGDPNPYDELPKLKMYTYDIGDIINSKSYQSLEDKAFNFHEFFRTWTGDYNIDQCIMPPNAKEGDFIHENDIRSFLKLLTKKDDKNLYPYSTEEFRDLFRHSLWMVPGVKEAKALKRLLLDTDVFNSGMFDIINVAGNERDEDLGYEEALTKVKNGIANAEKTGRYTITLSCGKLTTGVTIGEWTAVFMLSGSYSTSASSYLQTIFRVQSPCNKNGKIKETCYVFDFAPDRTLKMVAEAVSISTKAGKTSINDKAVLRKFLNFCPIISVSGSVMKEYSAEKLLQQLKKAYAERVVQNGFDDTNLYNDELLKLQDVDIEKFEKLKKIIKTTDSSKNTKDISVNNQGFTEEEYDRSENIRKKKKKELTPEDKEFLKELKRKKELKEKAISILRGISIRMPLLIYGADIPYEEDISLEKFVKIIDDSSWEEFMPLGVTKEIFKNFQKYYDEEIFIGAGRRIRNLTKKADSLPPIERVKAISEIFSCFKNPDKETVLTPWRIVNLHMSDSIGGYTFFTREQKEPLDEPVYINQGTSTTEVFNNTNTRILEINSKTGLYPLFATFNIYLNKIKNKKIDEKSIDELREVWNQCVKENIFVVCKTAMADAITKRTLVGYSNSKTNTLHLDNILETIKKNPENLISTIYRKFGTNIGINNMKFNAVIGNPPYQLKGGSGGNNDAPIYQHFVDIINRLKPDYSSLIIPARWFTAGRDNLLKDFRANMLNNDSIEKMFVYNNSRDIFPNVEIKGGVCYYLTNKKYHGECDYHLISKEINERLMRKLNDHDVLIRYHTLSCIVDNVIEKNKAKTFVDSIISSDTPFGIPSNPKGSKKNHWEIYPSPHDEFTTQIFHIEKSSRKIEYLDGNSILKNSNDISKDKVFITGGYGAGESFPHQILGVPEYAPKNSVCSQSYLYSAFNSEEEAKNFIKYLRTKFFRALVLAMKITQSAPSKVYRFVPMQDYSTNSDIDWSKNVADIDKQLYDKYQLSIDERDFIEKMIKTMTDIPSNDTEEYDDKDGE